MSVSKKYISAQQLLDDSFNLGLQILDSGFIPNYIVGVWRGGTPVGIAVQELLDYFGIHTDHIAIRTSLYTGIEKRATKVKVHGLSYIVKNANAKDSVLIVDDVYDTGLSVKQVVDDLHAECRLNTPMIKIATPYFKPDNNKTDKEPDYYLHSTDEWLVFPHELSGLSTQEILDNKPGIDSLREKLKQRLASE
jgi:hypoxanthine phosphoribosyltransferase